MQEFLQEFLLICLQCHTTAIKFHDIFFRVKSIHRLHLLPHSTLHVNNNIWLRAFKSSGCKGIGHATLTSTWHYFRTVPIDLFCLHPLRFGMKVKATKNIMYDCPTPDAIPWLLCALHIMKYFFIFFPLCGWDEEKCLCLVSEWFRHKKNYDTFPCYSFIFFYDMTVVLHRAIL